MTWTIHAMTQMAQQFDEKVRRDVSRFDRLIEPAAAHRTVLRDPASETAIEAAEQRLSVRLPPSYRTFLRVSNGAYASELGAELEHRPRHGLLPIEGVIPAAQGDPVGVQIWCEVADPAADQPAVPGDPQLAGYYPPYRDGLLISHMLDTYRLALVPRSGYEEWELWAFRHIGALTFPSFADFLAWCIARPDRWPSPDEADSLAKAVEDGAGFQTLEQLAELDPPRAAKLAIEQLAAGADSYPLPHLLGRIGDPEAIPVLREVYGRPGSNMLRMNALDALIRLGAHDATQLKRDAALNDADPTVREWAQRTLPPDDTE